MWPDWTGFSLFYMKSRFIVFLDVFLVIARSGFQCIKMSFRLNNFKFPSQSCCKRNSCIFRFQKTVASSQIATLLFSKAAEPSQSATLLSLVEVCCSQRCPAFHRHRHRHQHCSRLLLQGRHLLGYLHPDPHLRSFPRQNALIVYRALPMLQSGPKRLRAYYQSCKARILEARSNETTSMEFSFDSAY